MGKTDNITNNTDIINLLIILLIVPLLTIIIIYIQYAQSFELFFSEYSPTGKFYSLYVQSNIFSSIDEINNIIKNIGLFSIKSINIIFHIIVLVRFISAIQQKYSFLIKEFIASIFIIFLYATIIAPGLNIFIQIIGYTITIITSLIILLCIIVPE